MSRSCPESEGLPMLRKPNPDASHNRAFYRTHADSRAFFSMPSILNDIRSGIVTCVKQTALPPWHRSPQRPGLSTPIIVNSGGASSKLCRPWSCCKRSETCDFHDSDASEYPRSCQFCLLKPGRYLINLAGTPATMLPRSTVLLTTAPAAIMAPS